MDIDPNDQSDISRSSNDRDEHHEHIRRIGTQKYLRESYCHRIEWPAANFLATFMWTKPLNNASSTTVTHKTLERVSDGTVTQV